MSKVGWTGQVQWETRSGQKRMTLVAQPFLKAKTNTTRWAAICVEAPADADSLAEILRNHSHADLGDYKTLVECIAACEAYIDRWKAGKAREAACECKEIAVRQPKRVPRGGRS